MNPVNLDKQFLIPLAESLNTNFSDLKKRFEGVHATIYSFYSSFAHNCKKGGPLPLEDTFLRHLNINILDPTDIIVSDIFHKCMNFDLLTTTIKDERPFDHYLRQYLDPSGYINEHRPPMIGICVPFTNYNEERTRPSYNLALSISMELFKTRQRLEMSVHETIGFNSIMKPFDDKHKEEKPYTHVWTKDRINALLSKPKAAMLERLKKIEGGNP